MSWYANVQPTKVANFDAAVDAAEVNTGSTAYGAVESGEQIVAAKAAAKAILASGAIGPLDDPMAEYGCDISGHANPNHWPEPGWAGDQVTVKVYRNVVL